MLGRLNSCRQQQGQAIIFVVLFLGVVLLSLVFLYKAGKITSEKMQLQNAADAAAYSVSITEARDLNFMAYTNRAMVANEVAIGQMVGMASWASHWASYKDYLMAWERMFIYPVIGAASLGTAQDGIESTFLGITSTIFTIPGNFVYTVFKVIANIGATVLHNINKAYSVGQTGYHYGSMLYSLSAYVDLVDDNLPDAKISDFGVLSLIAHTFTYLEVLPQDNPNTIKSFVRTYTPSEPEHVEGFQRLAATVNGSRDEWQRKRGWTLPLDIPPLPIDIDKTGDDRINLDLGFGEVWFEILLQISFQLDKTGGSELRSLADGLGNQYNWSAADATSLIATIAFAAGAGLDIAGGTVAAASLGVSFADGKATLDPLTLTALGFEVEITPAVSFPFLTSVPFSSGSAQIGKTKVAKTDLYGIDDSAYGGTPKHQSAWGMDPTGSLAIPFRGAGGPTWSHLLIPPTVPTVIATMPTTQRRVNTSYKGLPSYSDTVPKVAPWGIEAPYFLSGVVKDAGDIYSDDAPLTNEDCINNTQDADAGTGLSVDNMFHLNDYCIADEELGAISKSEVYFSRPLDLGYFGRADDQEEYGSAFNPYWQARLVETTYADRMVALALQQGETFGTLDSIADLVSKLASLPTDIIDLF